MCYYDANERLYEITEEELQRIVRRAVEIALDEIIRIEHDSNIQTSLDGNICQQFI